MHRNGFFLLLFFLVPLFEVWIFVKVGREIGAPPLIALIFLTAAVGVYCLRRQGLQTLQRAQNSLAHGEVPALELLEGAQLLVAGALLLTPGFFTDTIGFTLLWPLVRRLVAAKLLGLLAQRTTMQAFRAESDENAYYQERDAWRREPNMTNEGRGHKSRQTIEGDFTREDE